MTFPILESIKSFPSQIYDDSLEANKKFLVISSKMAGIYLIAKGIQNIFFGDSVFIISKLFWLSMSFLGHDLLVFGEMMINKLFNNGNMPQDPEIFKNLLVTRKIARDLLALV